MTRIPPQVKSVCWNGLSLAVPARWETMVRGPHHLIMEQDLRPMLELRWHPAAGGGSGRKSCRAILAALQKEIDSPLVAVDPPEALRVLGGSHDVEVFARGDRPEPALALLTCTCCATHILARFFPGSAAWLSEPDALFHTLSCHVGGGAARPWAIMDVTFDLPEGYGLDTYSFVFGLSTLRFRSKWARLRLCRLAPATEHLTRSSLPVLFSAFNGLPEEWQVSVDGQTLVCTRTPGAVARILARVRRAQPYEWSRFEFLPEYDRILGIHLASSRPLRKSELLKLEDGYGMA